MQSKALGNADLHDCFVPIVDNKVDKNKAYDYALEGLRGLAALWVAYSHIFFYEFKLDPAYHPVFPFGTFFNAAHGGILIFFALSGYVIGLTNQLPFSCSNAIRYLLRRFIRLYPIYLVAVALGVLSAPTDTWKTITGNLIFLQGPISALLSGNGVLWTLHYEVVYYIIFLAVWYYHPKVSLLMIGSLIVACLPVVFPAFPKMISGYAAGWLFWLFGLWLAWKKPRSKAFTKFPLFSYILFYIAIDKLEIGSLVLKDLGLVTTKLSEISIVDFVYFPLCALIFASLTKRKLPYSRWCSMIAIALPVSYTIYLIAFGKLFSNETSLIAVAHMVLGFLLLRWQVSPDIFTYLKFIGSISYGIYVFHMPIMNFMNKISIFSGSLITFIIRICIWTGLTIGISYLLELKVQPLIKKRFKRKTLNYMQVDL
jgi:peptidoglycan/LPS O-acetylase OafA/YrhL